ncbi:PqiC family protein [Pararobbsia alpina]|uniref:PqiC family protein n=1 Tax=Pararobbsia alpina TaxID=621374 RepID=UPI0031B5796F
MLVVAMLAGCASQKSDFYTLSVEAPSDTTRSTEMISVVVGAVTVPELIDRPQIVIRGGANQVDIDEFARWAEPLKSQIPRVIAGDLALVLNSPRVSVYPIAGDSAGAFRVRTDVERFDAVPGESVTVDVMWSVSPPGKGRPISGRTTVREPCTGPGYGALVAAWSRALATVSRDIASAIRPAPAL